MSADVKGCGQGDRFAYELARLLRDVTTAITWYMQEHGVTEAILAARLGIPVWRVTQILSGGDELTLRPLAAICVALGAHFEVSLVPNTGS
jgi:antitoxin component HigA of HigAB toxin-antitoxin module